MKPLCGKLRIAAGRVQFESSGNVLFGVAMVSISIRDLFMEFDPSRDDITVSCSSIFNKCLDVKSKWEADKVQLWARFFGMIIMRGIEHNC